MRVALGQFGAELRKVQSNLDRMQAMVGEAAHAGAELVCFPELCLSGYLLDAADYTPELLRDVERAEEELAVESERRRITVIYGAPACREGRLQNTVVMQRPDRHRLIYARTHMAAIERAVFEPGGDLVIDERGIAPACCYDLAFPELARMIALHGARLLVVPMAWETQRGFVMRHVVPARAVENIAYVLCVNQCGTIGQLAFRGRSCAVDPLGQNCAYLGDETGLTVVDIDLDWVSQLREGFDTRSYPLFADRRPELYGPITQIASDPPAEAVDR
jgi:predicted amidohydrolase